MTLHHSRAWLVMAALGLASPLAVAKNHDAPNKPTLTGNKAAQTKTAEEKAVAQNLQSFVAELHVINQAEIRLGQLAERKGQEPATREFGRMLVKDHERLENELSTLAGNLDVPLQPKHPTRALKRLGREEEKTFDRLEDTKDDHFDLRFANEASRGHEVVLDRLDHFNERLEDEAAKRLMRDSVSTIERHRDAARDLTKVPFAH